MQRGSLANYGPVSPAPRDSCSPPAPHGQVTGRARYEFEGDTGKGRLEMHFRSGALEGKIVFDSKSERVGDC